jgi:hypothetical protein
MCKSKLLSHKFIVTETGIKHGKLYKDKGSNCFIFLVKQSIWYPLINVGKKHSHKWCSSWHEYNVSPHYKIVKFGENFKNILLKCKFLNYTFDYFFFCNLCTNRLWYPSSACRLYIYVSMYICIIVCVYGWCVCLCFTAVQYLNAFFSIGQ